MSVDKEVEIFLEYLKRKYEIIRGKEVSGDNEIVPGIPFQKCSERDKARYPLLNNPNINGYIQQQLLFPPTPQTIKKLENGKYSVCLNTENAPVEMVLEELKQHLLILGKDEKIEDFIKKCSTNKDELNKSIEAVKNLTGQEMEAAIVNGGLALKEFFEEDSKYKTEVTKLAQCDLFAQGQKGSALFDALTYKNADGHIVQYVKEAGLYKLRIIDSAGNQIMQDQELFSEKDKTVLESLGEEESYEIQRKALFNRMRTIPGVPFDEQKLRFVDANGNSLFSDKDVETAVQLKDKEIQDELARMMFETAMMVDYNNNINNDTNQQRTQSGDGYYEEEGQGETKHIQMLANTCKFGGLDVNGIIQNLKIGSSMSLKLINTTAKDMLKKWQGTLNKMKAVPFDNKYTIKVYIPPKPKGHIANVGNNENAHIPEANIARQNNQTHLNKNGGFTVGGVLVPPSSTPIYTMGTYFPNIEYLDGFNAWMAEMQKTQNPQETAVKK